MFCWCLHNKNNVFRKKKDDCVSSWELEASQHNGIAITKYFTKVVFQLCIRPHQDSFSGKI